MTEKEARSREAGGERWAGDLPACLPRRAHLGPADMIGHCIGWNIGLKSALIQKVRSAGVPPVAYRTR